MKTPWNKPEAGGGRNGWSVPTLTSLRPDADFAAPPFFGGRALPVVAVVAALLAGCEDDPMRDVPEEPTYSSHVAQILQANCLACHSDEGIAPLSLERYDDARREADRIARVTREGRMPPWLPEAGSYPFQGERHLTPKEVAILQRWADAGAPGGDLAAVPEPPVRADGWLLGEPDLVLEMSEPYITPVAQERQRDEAHGHEDLFRNFVIAVPVDEVQHVRAVEFHPGDPRVVHHVILSVDPTPGSRRADARDPEPGFDGMFARTGARPPGGFFIGWTPGRMARPHPEGLTWSLEPDTDFVIQAHLRPVDEPVEVRSRIGFHFADEPADRTPLLLQLTGRTIQIPPGGSAYTVEDSFQLPVDVEVLAIYPHAHYLARTMDVRAVFPGGEERTLLRIPRWDFDWQETYTYESPVSLPAGTEIRMEYVYDNSGANPRNPHDPPREVVYGPNSTDEMAELWLQALPANPSEFDILQDAMALKQRTDRVRGWRHLVELDPDDAWAHANLAAAYEAREQTHLALQHYQTAVELDPEIEEAHFGLALILEARGDVEGALGHYGEAARLFPGHAGAQNNLANLLYYEGRFDDAERHYHLAIDADSSHTEAYVNLGNLLRDEGRNEEALEQYRRAAEISPELADVHINLAFNLILLGEPEDAMDHLVEVTRIAPRALEPHLSAAWMMVTHPERDSRRPDLAMQLVEAVRNSLRADHPLVLDVLAATHAAAGRFEVAEEVAKEALRLATEMGERELAGQIADRLELYREGRPYVAPAGPPEDFTG